MPITITVLTPDGKTLIRDQAAFDDGLVATAAEMTDSKPNSFNVIHQTGDTGAFDMNIEVPWFQSKSPDWFHDLRLAIEKFLNENRHLIEEGARVGISIGNEGTMWK